MARPKQKRYPTRSDRHFRNCLDNLCASAIVPVRIFVFLREFAGAVSPRCRSPHLGHVGFLVGNRILTFPCFRVILYSWKLLIDKGITKTEMRKRGLGTNVLAKMEKNGTVSMETLVRIADVMERGLDDIVEINAEKGGNE